MIATPQMPVLTGGEQAAAWIAAQAPGRPPAQLAAHLDGPSARALADAVGPHLPRVLATSDAVGTAAGRDALQRPDVAAWCGRADGAQALIVRVSRVGKASAVGPAALVRLG